ncbi:hypothetical protein DIPPA_01729 [Diplonema papillatum]|nr:hypothetical protein DIPPA_01729 [Diplonema papillatum]
MQRLLGMRKVIAVITLSCAIVGVGWWVDSARPVGRQAREPASSRALKPEAHMQKLLSEFSALYNADAAEVDAALAPTEAKPAPTVANPVPTVAKPVPTVAKPVPTDSKLAPTDKPAPTNFKPAPKVAKPAPTDSKSAPTDAKFAPTETKAIEVRSKQNATGAPRAELGKEFCQSNDALFPGKLFSKGRSRKVWKPDNCKFRGLESLNVKKCFAGKKLVFLGDSLTRDIVRRIGRFGLGQDSKMHPFTSEEKGPVNHTMLARVVPYGQYYKVDNGKFEFYWSAAARYDGSLNFSRTQQAIREADLVWIGSGSWDMGNLHVPPETYFDLMTARVERIRKAMKPGARLVLFPVHWLHLDKGTPNGPFRRCNDPAKASVFRDALRTVAACQGLPVVETAEITKPASAYTQDGIHYDRDLPWIEADVIVNHFCTTFALSTPQRACDVDAAKQRWRKVRPAYVGCTPKRRRR